MFPFLWFADELSFTGAVDLDRLEGLRSYNVVDNPKYKDAFPFAEKDYAHIREIGIAEATRLKTMSRMKAPPPRLQQARPDSEV